MQRKNRRNPHAERSFDRFCADSGRAAGAGDLQKPRTEADDLCALVGRAAEIVSAGDAVFSAGSSTGGHNCSGADCAAARTDYTGDPTAGAKCGAASNSCAAAGFPGTRNCEAADDCADFSDCLVQRQRAAWTMAFGCVAGVYDSAAPRPAFSRQARRNVHLCFRRGQIAVSGRTHSGGLSDGGRTANRCGGIDSVP